MKNKKTSRLDFLVRPVDHNLVKFQKRRTAVRLHIHVIDFIVAQTKGLEYASVFENAAHQVLFFVAPILGLHVDFVSIDKKV